MDATIGALPEVSMLFIKESTMENSCKYLRTGSRFDPFSLAGEREKIGYFFTPKFLLC